ncbi:MAG: hypothetical protein QXH32_05635 [Candidatus Caldarchaeum sp.]
MDAKGVKVHKRGEWVRELYGPKVRRKMVSVKVADERVRDSRVLKPLSDESVERCEVV